MKKWISVLLVLTLLYTLCGCQTEKPGQSEGDSDSTTGETAAVDFAQTDSDMFTGRDLEGAYDEKACIQIRLNGDSVSASSDAVHISGTTVTLSKEAVYMISGTLSDGMIVVDADDGAKLQLVLSDASVNSTGSAALYVKECDKVFVTLAEGTENTLSNDGSFAAIDDNNIDGAVYSRQDMTFNGSGSLTVDSPAGHGIVCKDDLVFTGGSYTVNAASHGLNANDSVRITSAALSIDAGKDGIHAENTDDATLGFVYMSGGSVDVEAEGDGISAGPNLQIKGGSIDILTGGGSENGPSHNSDAWGDFMGGDMGGGRHPGPRPAMETSADTSDDSTSMKGIKTTGGILVAGGTITIDSADDAVHANGSITVNGGVFEIATGDDGFHADETFTITAGTVNITECYEGLEALDIDVSGGDIKLKASDDGLNAAGGTDSSGMGGFHGGDMFGGGKPGDTGGPSNGSIVISGGNLYINSSGDGMDANGSLTISGGYTVVVGPTHGDTATLDYDTGGVITGGTFIGTGASMMAQTFSDSQQGVIAVSVGNQAANTQLTLTDRDGNTVISYTPELSFQVVILSSPDIVKGESYTITVGESSGTFEAG